MAKLAIRLLGDFRIEANGSQPSEVPSGKNRALLAWLACQCGSRLGRDAATGLLWGDRPQKQANASLSQALYSLRRTLGEIGQEVLQADSETLTMPEGAAEVDAKCFSDLAARRDYDSLEAAEALYGGPFLDGFAPPTPEFDEWMQAERRQLDAEAIDALTALLALRTERDEGAARKGTARRLLELDPYHEPAARALMQYLASRGRLGRANKVYEQLCRVMAEDLGAEPSDETTALHRSILRHETTAAGERLPGPHRGTQAPRRTSERFRRLAGSSVLCLALVAGAWAWWHATQRAFEPVDVSSMSYPLPDRPSIAVLAFEDLSAGADAGYLSDAISEGVTTALARFDELFVIARNSSYYYRDKAADVREIARQLGVRYILEGSQQKFGDKLRVNIQLIDAVAGNHVWARSYDRDLVDLFTIQDEIAGTVASTVGPQILDLGGDEARRADPARLTAFQHFLSARRSFREFTRDGTRKAHEAGLRAIEADPTMPEGHIGLAFVYINGYRWGWLEMSRDEALARARKAAQAALLLAPDSYSSQEAMAYVHIQAGELDEAIARFEKSLALNPSAAYVMANMAEALGYAGRATEAAALLEHAMRLDPHHQDWFNWNLGSARWLAGDCRGALATLQAMSRPPAFANRMFAIVYVCLRRLDEARAAIARLREAHPGYSIADVRLNFRGKYRNSADLERYIDRLRSAGLPESPPDTGPQTTQN